MIITQHIQVVDDIPTEGTANQSSCSLNTEQGRKKENSAWPDHRIRSNFTNKNIFHYEKPHTTTKTHNETTYHEGPHGPKGTIKGKMWREKIRVREREEKKKRLMEVNNYA